MIENKKKVLILSGASYMIEAVETAKALGLYTIVTDNTMASPAKKYADKAYNSSAADLWELAEIAKIEQIAGVFNMFDDINTWHALALCKKMGLPIYTSSEQPGSYPNNYRFKEYCQTFNVPVIEVSAFDSLYALELAAMGFPAKEPNWALVKQPLQVV
ncbi:hypothetical protein [Planomicrobium sp. CPCC 101079]|uniref:hypothetical protein n=1 Tax=Planomicrobium sp. CPCC 101079 TaxID=2599618 RepID=UPI0011B43A88|nr:hypothetical protein [Planomicrobium sp. CPCC 101079]TWT01920.1 hypothetical protein FQV28_14915 [Planomicrobium sp. CPCC 101079]